MNYAVVWNATAEERLAALWMAAAEPRAINDAVESVERLLRRDPLDVGESRPGRGRLMFSGPIGVYYRVDQATRTVTVLWVGPAHPPRRT